MSLAGTAQMATNGTSGGQGWGGQYVAQPLGFQYQTPGGAYWVAGDLGGTVGQFISRYFAAC